MRARAKQRGNSSILCVMERTHGEANQDQGYQHFLEFPSLRYIKRIQSHSDQNWLWPGNDSGQAVTAMGNVYQVNCWGRNILKFQDPFAMNFVGLAYTARSPFTETSFRPVGIDFVNGSFYVLAGNPVNLVEHSGAEDGFISMRGGLYRAGRGTATRVTSPARTGQYSVKVTGDGQNGSHYYFLGESDDGSISPFANGTTYDLEVWVYIPSGQGTITLGLYGWDGSTDTTIDSTTTQDQWVKLSGTWTPNATPAQNDCTKVFLARPGGENESAYYYIDDWFVEEHNYSNDSHLIQFDESFNHIKTVALETISSYQELDGLTVLPNSNFMAATMSGHVVEFTKEGKIVRDKQIDADLQFRGATLRDGYFVTSSIYDESTSQYDATLYVLSYPGLDVIQTLDMSSHLNHSGNCVYGTFFI